MHRIVRALWAPAALLCGLVVVQSGISGTTPAIAGQSPASLASAPLVAGFIPVSNMASMCQPAVVQAIAASLPVKTTVQKLPAAHVTGPMFADGVSYKPAAKGLPAYCQITGSFVTNPKTGKTANFLATLPEAWNQKYLQLGCSGHCGTFAVSNAASVTITITNQGKPGDAIGKGYASFATDEGHAGFQQGAWAIKGPGQIDDDAVEDFLYRSQKVMAQVGKAFSTAFYAQATGTSRRIAYSYFCGCSGGGRDALVAASYFPEEFDGIVSGSPYANMADLAFLTTGVSLATARSPGAALSPALIARIDPIVKAKCDAVDGVKDDLIQNPAACDFRPEKDLPRCADEKAGDQCFTRAQIESVSTLLTAATDASGKVVQPGYSVSEVQAALLSPPAKADSPDPWPDTGNPGTGGGGVAPLGDAVLRIFTHRNDPAFHTPSIISFAAGGRGPVTGYRVVVPAAEVARANAAMRMGIGAIPQNAARLIRLDRKLLIWSNSSDQLLTPYMAVNYYARLAKMYGGYAKLQKNVRLFMLPGTAHCSGGGNGVGPGSFDALDAIENWVERKHSPNAIPATLYQNNQFGVDFSKPLGRTMPLCKFPTMARYNGRGNVKDGANWSCPAGDQSMLKLGESGRQAGVIL